jgi:hypothetical protein
MEYLGAGNSIHLAELLSEALDCSSMTVTSSGV